jgi:hypothetical protein
MTRWQQGEVLVKNADLLMAAVIFASGVAVAQTNRYTATLAQPVAAKQVIANSNIWRCDGSTCVLTSFPSHPDALRSCHELQRQVGVLTVYGSKEKPFDAETLAKCNAEH